LEADGDYDLPTSIDVFDSVPVVEIYDLNSTPTGSIEHIQQDTLYPKYSLTTDMLPIGIESGSASFGMCVSINDNFVAVGNPFTYEVSGRYTGCVHIFKGNIIINKKMIKVFKN
jgi:hypothetical protein